MAMQRQRGVALITAIAVVAVAVSLAAYLAFDQQISIRQTRNLLQHDQARQYTRAAEAIATLALVEDRADGDVDALDEAWAHPIVGFQIDEHAQVSGYLVDLQGRFNLNAVVDESGKIDAVAYARLERLLQALELPVALAPAIADWIDSDLEPYGADGAEDGFYTRLTPAYRTANTAIRSIEELRLIRGVDQAALERLAPYVSALPERTPININTAPREVLMALGLTGTAADTLIEQRDSNPFASVEVFLATEQAKAAKLDNTQLGVSSNYFGLYNEITFIDTRLNTFSLLVREDNGGVTALERRQELR